MKQRSVGLMRIWACCGLAACAWSENASDLEPDDLDELTVEQARKIVATHRGVVSSQGMKLAYIPAGKFGMGSPRQEAGREAQEKGHEVELTRAFYLGTHQVTVGQFRKFVDNAKYRTDGERDGKGGWGVNEKGSLEKDGRFTWSSPGFKQTNDHPVVLVSWNDAQAYCRWLSKKENKTYRLPTEAEWEYACRAGTATRWSFGDDEGLLGDYAWFQGNARDVGRFYGHAVGTKLPNAWGLYDMSGNVFEWTWDWYDSSYYSNSPSADPEGPSSGSRRVYRGGSYDHVAHNANIPNYQSVTHRLSETPSTWWSSTRGFRLARTIP